VAKALVAQGRFLGSGDVDRFASAGGALFVRLAFEDEVARPSSFDRALQVLTVVISDAETNRFEPIAVGFAT
jgi:hypothetical protein